MINRNVCWEGIKLHNLNKIFPSKAKLKHPSILGRVHFQTIILFINDQQKCLLGNIFVGKVLSSRVIGSLSSEQNLTISEIAV